MNNDLISRSELKKALKSNCDLCHDKNTNWCERCCPHNDFEDLIDDAPTVEINDKSLEIARKSIELGRKVGKLEGQLARPQGDIIKCQDCKHQIKEWREE